jgi:5'-deoxynucleotidase YfbR-like HD superfamily hydrolase
VTDLTDKLELMRRGGRVQRFHTMTLLMANPVGHHTFNLTSIIYCCVPEPRLTMSLLYAAHVHDIPECETGDMPAPFKRRVAGLRDQMDAAEEEVLASVGLEIPELTPDEQRWLKLADSLDGAMHCLEERRLGNRTTDVAFGNFMHYVNNLLGDSNQHRDDAKFYDLAFYISNEWGNL